mmetsp:Transcript_32020/g.84040  ORF Transcript_32020/g.84040 Transcript_32020/m.84040 type:complete len:233 (-) Transcript_32020:1152-1850(-)
MLLTKLTASFILVMLGPLPASTWPSGGAAAGAASASGSAKVTQRPPEAATGREGSALPSAGWPPQRRAVSSDCASCSQRSSAQPRLKVWNRSCASFCEGCDASRRLAVHAIARRRSLGSRCQRRKQRSMPRASACVISGLPADSASRGSSASVPKRPSSWTSPAVGELRIHPWLRACSAVHRSWMSGFISLVMRSTAPSDTPLQTSPVKSGGRPWRIKLGSSPKGRLPESMT